MGVLKAGVVPQDIFEKCQHIFRKVLVPRARQFSSLLVTPRDDPWRLCTKLFSSFLTLLTSCLAFPFLTQMDHEGFGMIEASELVHPLCSMAMCACRHVDLFSFVAYTFSSTGGIL